MAIGLKIIFICGSLEPGKDGVGDYCIQLAKGMQEVSASCKVALMSLNDHWIHEIVETESLLRIPATLGNSVKQEQLISMLNRFDPDVVSFQYVPYAFHAKGLPLHLVGWLKNIKNTGVQTQWVAHETWIGIPTTSSFKHKLIGWLQKQLLKKFLSTFQPSVLFTTNPVYTGMFESIGESTELLPLFSNINRFDTANVEPFYEKLEISGSRREQYLIAGVFGNVPNEWEIETNLNNLIQWAANQQKQAICLFIGNPNQPEGYFDPFRNMGSLKIQTLGILPEEEISGWLQMLDFGFATTPPQLVGKSGSVQAMLEHGVPVVLSRNDWVSRYPLGKSSTELPNGLYLLKEYGNVWTETDLEPFKPCSNKPKVIKTLLEHSAF